MPRAQLNGNPIADTAIRQPVFITMMALVTLVIGLLAYRSLPVEYFPSFSVPIVAVSVADPGADPQTMADQVAKPIEDALTNVSGVQHITSISNEGQTQIVVEFGDGVDPEQALQDVRDQVSAIQPLLPSGASDPVFQKFDPTAAPVLQAVIAADDGTTPLQLRDFVDTTVVPALQRVEGAGLVQVAGGQQRQINIDLRLDRLQALQITPAQVSQAIAGANLSAGLGAITAGDQSVSLRVPSAITGPADIAAVPIAGTPYSVGDVAGVEDGVAEATSYARLNGKDAVTIGVLKQSGANVVQVAENTREALAALLADYPDIRYVVTNDQASDVLAAVDNTLQEILLAVVAAVLVVLLFFRNLRNTLVTVAGLPVILVGTFATMAALGITVNVVSLLALSLSVGLVVDDAIVVRENIFRHLERGESPWVAASRGTAQVALSVLAMSLTIVAVFLPVALVSGPTGAIFRGFGLTVAAAMLISLVEAFTLAPMLSAHLFPERSTGKGGAADPSEPRADRDAELAREAREVLEEGGTTGRLERGYERLLGWTLRRRWAAPLVAVVAFAASLWVAAGLRFDFAPAQQSDTFAVSYSMAPGASLAASDRLARQAEAAIQADPAVTAVQTQVSPGSGSFTVRVASADQTAAARARLSKALAFLPELVLSTQSFQGGVGTGVTGRNVQVQISSPRDAGELAGYATQIQQAMGSIAGFVDIGSTYGAGSPTVDIQVNPALGRELEVDNGSLAAALRTLIGGDTVATWQSDGDDIPIVVRLPPATRDDAGVLQGISLPTEAGNVPLSSLARLEPGEGPASIRRYDRQTQIVIGANVAPGLDQNALQQELSAQIAALGLPPDVSVSYGGVTQSQNEGFTELFTAMGLSVLFVYVVLASQFGSYAQPLVIMLAMPFSLLGAFVALRLAGLPLDVTGMVGLIMLLGLVVKNSILLVDFANRLRRAGVETRTAMEWAGTIRLRPILMTSTAIIAGALPSALGLHLFGTSANGSFSRGLATVLIGGVLTSTLLTLLVVPSAYSLLIGAQARLGTLFRRRRPFPPADTEPPQDTDKATTAA